MTCEECARYLKDCTPGDDSKEEVTRDGCDSFKEKQVADYLDFSKMSPDKKRLITYMILGSQLREAEKKRAG